MPGNSKRQGAVRKVAKKGPTKGTGGKGRRSLEGRGPTPKAEDRTYHVAHKRKAAQERREAARPKAAARPSPAAPANKPPADWVVGRNSVLEALRAGVPAFRLDVATGIDTDPRIAESLKLAGDQGLDMRQVTKRDLDQRIGLNNQGVALRVAPYEYAHPMDLLRAAEESGTEPLIVALDQVSDPHNLGAVLRSAAAFGAHGVLVPERRSAPMGPAAWKVSAGAAARVPVARAVNLVTALKAYKKKGAFVVGLDAAGAADAARISLASGPLVVVIGSEGKGLARLTREACDLTVSIPIDSATESLNAAVAAGIMLYEVAKQRRAPTA
ncbi:MAG: 23S rRNA (guanosine(2251)-2'-O)-methyltransferase RlmB [Bifidobacteriaceae bacterium]|jgi:23S rRNA (guanosine2251-2'-O)-methyltransferase|nr:23S rRNA (guanosine(2251)-2'-O)-methyltransferase RlmB [Bifidobacteriaceae bacterium]